MSYLIWLSHLAHTGILSEGAACWLNADIPFVTTPSPAGGGGVDWDGANGLGAPAGLGALKIRQPMLNHKHPV